MALIVKSKKSIYAGSFLLILRSTNAGTSRKLRISNIRLINDAGPNWLLANIITIETMIPDVVKVVTLSQRCRNLINNATDIASTRKVKLVQGANPYIKVILRFGKPGFCPAASNQPMNAAAGNSINKL